ncbi:related to Phospholipase/Carboxylesterase superfamily [Rhynchosporium agropyri]|uniref:Related to Phospholipase/Carboxylesterase superfamily n=1 Tax=Rhynchosporium agropyri TaxID=914238 RepID=A0A1E1LCY6_9HELO|nr:related to Phospholipase/Carboxylesterase superfamily [Rhynchosporium agropyri]
MPLSRIPTKADFPSNLILDIIPPPSGSPVNILILLHGLGDTQTSFSTLGKNLNLPETVCISIRGLNPIPPIFTGSETPAFHWGDDVLVDEGKGEIDPDGGFKMVESVLGAILLKALIEECGFQARNIHFLGFGQGGMVALHLASCREEEFGGVISIGGRLPASSSQSAEKCKTPILLCGGSRSPQVTRSAVDAIKARFMHVEYVKWEKGDDSMPKNRDEMLPLMKFLARRLRSRAGVPEGAIEV